MFIRKSQELNTDAFEQLIAEKMIHLMPNEVITNTLNMLIFIYRNTKRALLIMDQLNPSRLKDVLKIARERGQFTDWVDTATHHKNTKLAAYLRIATEQTAN